jgi:hypothetical protein
MKTIKLLSFLIITISANISLAQKGGGYGMGNGGDAVVCYTDSTRSVITSVQMFDYWEQEQVMPFGKVDLGASNLSVQDKIEIVSNRISKFDPELADKIKFQALNLANNIQNYLVTSYQLPDIDDMTPQVVPTKPNCFIEQYGVQYKDLVTGQKRFYIADKFYNFPGINNDDKAGLLLHEAIYRFAILQRPSLDNSDGVRYFNYVAGSKKIDSMTLDDVKIYDSFIYTSNLRNKLCSISFSNKVPGQYLVYDEYNKVSEVCYNQQVRLNSKILLFISQGSTINLGNFYGIDKTGEILNYADKKLILSVDDGSYKINNYYLSGLRLDLSNVALLYWVNKTPFVGADMLIEGPKGFMHTCRSGIVYDLINLKPLSCTTDLQTFFYNGLNYNFGGYVKSLGNDLWQVGISNQEYSLLGSKNNAKIIIPNGAPDINSQCKSDKIVINNDLELVSGCFNKPYSFKIDGKVSQLFNDFKVELVNGKFTLNGFVKYGNVLNPTYQGLNLIKSSNYIKYDYCQNLDYNPTVEVHDSYFRKSQEYVGAVGKSYFDISNNVTVYKSDEDVEYIQSLYCNNAKFDTSNF